MKKERNLEGSRGVKQKSKESENGLRFIADKGMENMRGRKQMNKDEVMYAQPQWYSFL
jgi:hypothetical protein